MVIRKKRRRTGKHVIDLTGPQGNAYCLLAYAEQWSKMLGKDFEDISKRMKSSDYENLLKVFDEEFGNYFILER